MVLETILQPLQVVATNASEVVAPAVVSAADTLLDNTLTLLTLLIALASSPGIVALANYFGKSKERQAGQELLGLVATEIRDVRKDVASYGTFLYNMLPEDKKKIADEQVIPVITTANDKLNNLNEELTKLTPKLAPSARAALRKI